MTKKEALKEAAEYIKEKCYMIKSDMDDRVGQIFRAAENGNTKEFMALKGELFKVLISAYLIGSKACPYCISGDFRGEKQACEGCEYGEQKGLCNKEGSVWREMHESINNLFYAIDRYSKDCPEISEKRTLKLGNVKVVDDRVEFQIVEQSHRGFEFWNGGDHFAASNGIILISSILPEVLSGTTWCCWCRGSKESMDDVILTTDISTYARIVEAVKEYNEPTKVPK